MQFDLQPTLQGKLIALPEKGRSAGAGWDGAEERAVRYCKGQMIFTTETPRH